MHVLIRDSPTRVSFRREEAHAGAARVTLPYVMILPVVSLQAHHRRFLLEHNTCFVSS